MYKPVISVVMSIYNESLIEIRESIDSLLMQSFNQIEIIIVIDNPDHIEAIQMLESYSSKDNRIILLYNKSNIGLAMSMNKAINIAKGEIIVRMDADDICDPTRIEKEYEALNRNNVDFVFTRFTCIDEHGKRLPIETTIQFKQMTSEQIRNQLAYRSYIHHPTVMFKKVLFDRTGGYRDFPCAQDYDLWIRMMEGGAQFYMLDESLLLYRIRPNNITSTRKIDQMFTLEYIRNLYIQRLKEGTDSFSKDNYQQYIQKRIHNKRKEKNNLLLSGNKKLLIINQKTEEGKNRILMYILKIITIFFNSVLRSLYFRLFLQKKKIINLQKNNSIINI